MSSKEIIVSCPCCKTKLWIDRETSGIIKKEDPHKTKKGFDNLFAKYKQDQSARSDGLTKAFEEEKKRKELMKKKFQKSIRDADKEQNKGKEE